MSPTAAHEHSLDHTDQQSSAEALEKAWRGWQFGKDLPRWEQYIPPLSKPCSAEVIGFILLTDIEFRAKAGLPALLSEPYFQHPRLQQADSQLDADGQVKLIRWEYQQRWKHGDLPRRSEYETAFPQHTAALHDLAPRWNCPSCRHKAIPQEDEAAEKFVCPHCGSEFSLTEIISPRDVPAPSAGGLTPAGLDLRDYELLDQLGAGGMGEVYRGRDPSLGRELAVKVMLPELGQDTDIQGRFIREARITGSLQHPGIVPVHNLGRLPDSRLYFTMKLVRGLTLERILADKPTPTPEERAQWLGVFEKVCQAVGYAHSKGVIHRDLKPSNVMVGRFGEVQVMDWGLAKVLTAQEEPTPRVEPASPKPEQAAIGALQPAALVGTAVERETVLLASDAAATSDLSQAGMLLGTLTFMPPEQAQGRLHLLDERADVFALGGILCMILTGHPPYTPGPTHELLFKVARGDLREAFQRLNNSGADADLTALCRECLAAERDRRPRNAGAVAERINGYLASVQERLRRAELDRATARVQATEERRRRRLHMALAAAFVVLLLGVGSVALWYQQYQSERDIRSQKLNDSVVKGLEDAEADRRDLHGRLSDAQKVAVLLSDLQPWDISLGKVRSAWSQAHKIADSDPELLDSELLERLGTLKQRLKADEEDRDFVLKWETVKLKMMEVGGAVRLKSTERYAQLFRTKGWHVAEKDMEAVAAQMERSPIRLVVSVILDSWAHVLLSAKPRDDALLARLLALSRHLDPDPWRDRLRQVTVWSNPNELRQLIGKLEPRQQPPQTLYIVAELQSHFGEEPAVLLRRALLEYPGDFYLNFALGLKTTDLAESNSAYRAALALRPNSGTVLNNLGLTLGMKGDLDGAMDRFRKALEYYPDYAVAYANLGKAFYEKRDLEGAIAHYNKALALEPDLVETHNNLGAALVQKGELDRALGHIEKALKLQPDHLQAGNNLAETLRLQGKYAEAVEAMGRVLASPLLKAGRREEYAGRLKNYERLLTLSKVEKSQIVDEETLRQGLEGTLSTDDPLDVFAKTSNSHRQSHAVQLKAGVSYQVDLAGDFDTFLRIEDNLYHPLVHNDNIHSKTNLNSRVIFTPSRAGVYRLVVTSLQAHAKGRYSLKLQEVVAAGQPAVYQDRLTKNDQKTSQGTFYKFHAVRLEANQSCMAYLTSAGFDAQVYVFDVSGKEILAIGGAMSEGNNPVSRLDFTPAETGMYQLVVMATKLGATGPYQVRLQKYQQP